MTENSINHFYCVKYQKSDSCAGWRNFHLVLSSSEYEYFTDMRLFFKLSVSFLIAIAIDKYLHLVCNKLLKKTTDNYPFKDYCFIMKKVNNVKCFITYWGKEGKLPEKKEYEAKYERKEKFT